VRERTAAGRPPKTHCTAKHSSTAVWQCKFSCC